MTADATDLEAAGTEAGGVPADVDTPHADSETEHEAADHVTDLATELGEALADLPEHEAYVEAEAAVRESEDVQEAIASFNERRREFAHARQTGDATEADLEELQAAQRELHAMPVMAEYLEAQERLQATLGAVEAAISDPLAVDFGETAGGCCQD
jgi:cell fate (sporulation/competence/biofilm development) regulator YlbF (YheA/YmcA/DUF963 family)